MLSISKNQCITKVQFVNLTGGSILGIELGGPDHNCGTGPPNSMRRPWQELSNHIGGIRVHQASEALTGQQPLQDLSMELIYQEMNALKSKAKVYDSLLLVVFGLIIVLIMCLIVVSFKN